jgi:hypothetical protein
MTRCGAKSMVAVLFVVFIFLLNVEASCAFVMSVQLCRKEARCQIVRAILISLDFRKDVLCAFLLNPSVF